MFRSRVLANFSLTTLRRRETGVSRRRRPRRRRCHRRRHRCPFSFTVVLSHSDDLHSSEFIPSKENNNLTEKNTGAFFLQNRTLLRDYGVFWVFFKNSFPPLKSGSRRVESISERSQWFFFVVLILGVHFEFCGEGWGLISERFLNDFWTISGEILRFYAGFCVRFVLLDSHGSW